MASESDQSVYGELMRRAARFASEDDYQRARATYLKAWRAEPWHAEPLYEIARQYRREGRFELGYLFARRAVEIPSPQLDSGSIDADVYVWRAIDELALCAFETGRYEEGFELTSQLLEARSLPESERARISRSREICRRWTGTGRGEYPTAVVEKIQKHMARGRTTKRAVTLTITSCRRPVLFERSINSFLRCCLDVERIDRWLCIDSGTTEDERTRIRERFPFFDFMYTEAGVSHGHSMNRLMDAVSTPFWLHLEDDWQFVARRRYIEEGTGVLADDPSIAQLAFNPNYAEVHEHLSTGGYVRRTVNGVRYRLHEQLDPGTPEWGHHVRALPAAVRVAAWWPHFTLNPSLMSAEAVRSVGKFISQPGRDFELDFAWRFAASGLRSAFFDEISCVHIGRLRDQGPNEGRVSAYDLVEDG